MHTTETTTSTAAAAATSRQVIERAIGLVRAGRFAEAIAYTTTENQRLRDPQLEYRLVKWRHGAFDASDARSRPDWPPSVPDLFAGASGPPEIAASALDLPTLASGILHHGCLIVRGLVPPAEAGRLAEGIRAVFEGLRAAKSGTSIDRTLPWFAPFQIGDPEIATGRGVVQKAGAAVWIADSPRMLVKLIDVFDRRGVISVIQQYLGERPVLSVEKATLRLVAPTSGSDWHQDGAFLGPQTRAVNVWLALSDCGVDAPALDLLPRRIPYVVETGTHGAKFNWSVGREKVLLEAGDIPIAKPVFVPGDAVLFDHFCLHRTGVEPGMTRERLAIESWFFAPSSKPQSHHALVV